MIGSLAYYGHGGGSAHGLLDEVLRWVAHAAIWQVVRRVFRDLTVAQAVALAVVLVALYGVVRYRRGRRGRVIARRRAEKREASR